MTSVAAPDLVRPAHLWVPDHVSSAGAEACDLAASAGLVLDGEQRLAMDAMLAEDEGGNYAAAEFAIIAARQNMKTALFQASALHDLFLCEDRLVIWTAHLFDTAQEAFRDLDNLLGSSDAFVRRILRVTRGNGDEGFELKTGQRLKFKARSKTGGRGLTGDKVYLDEAFALSASEMGALLFTLSARPNPQVRYGSSAGLDTSAFLRSLRDRGRAMDDPSLAYVEWCAPEGSCTTEQCDHMLGVAGCALDDPEMWRQANPAMDRRISQDRIASERRALGQEPEEFARERLGWWSNPGTADMPYPKNDWDKLADRPSQLVAGSVPVFAIDTNPARTRTAIAVCGDREDGLHHLEVAKYEPGTAWVVAKAAELFKATGATFYVLADGAANTLIPGLIEAGVSVVPVKTSEYVQACGLMSDAIQAKSFRHLAQEPLDDAVLMARKRNLEGAWALARKGGDIAPLVATVVARHFHEINSNYDPMDSFG